MSRDSPTPSTTSKDRRSNRPLKKRALSPTSQHAHQVSALFAKPDQEIRIPESATQKQRPLAPPPEIVTNVQGSSAGAGSGEFHVYKAARRREYERLRRMDEESRLEREKEEFDRDRRDREAKDDERTRKNREKREKAKARKAKARVKDSAGPGASTDAVASDKMGGGKAALPTSSKRDAPSTSEATQSGNDAAGPAPVADEPAGLVIHDDDE